MFSINCVIRRKLGSLKRKLRLTSNVPKECFPVYVGQNQKRFVVPLDYLSSPIFQSLLDRSAEEFGGKFEGVIVLTCNVKLFKEALKRVRAQVKEEEDDDDDQSEEYYYDYRHSHSQFLDVVEKYILKD